MDKKAIPPPILWADGRDSVSADIAFLKEEIGMSTLIGVYRDPDEARIEMDDEARRAVGSVLSTGGRIAGSFGSKTGKANIDRLMREVADQSTAIKGGAAS